MEEQKFRRFGTGDGDERPQLVVNAAPSIAGHLPSCLQLRDGAVLVNDGSLNVDNAVKRRVRNGRQKKALAGGAWGGDRDRQQNRAGKRGQSQTSGHTESLTTYFTGTLLPLALAWQGFREASPWITTLASSRRCRGRAMHKLGIFQSCKIPEAQRIVEIALRTARRKDSGLRPRLLPRSLSRDLAWNDRTSFWLGSDVRGEELCWVFQS